MQTADQFAGSYIQKTRISTLSGMMLVVGRRYTLQVYDQLRYPGWAGFTYRRYYGQAWTPWMDYWPRVAYLPSARAASASGLESLSLSGELRGGKVEERTEGVEISPGVFL